MMLHDLLLALKYNNILSTYIKNRMSMLSLNIYNIFKMVKL